MFRRFIRNRPISALLSSTLLLAGLAAAVFVARPSTGALASPNFIDSGQALGGDAESWAVALGDFDGDGDPDAIVANYNGASRVYVNQGGGQGGSAGEYQDSGQALGSEKAVDVALGDLDGDTDLDAFILLDSFGDSNQVWINQGLASGTFSQTAQIFGDQLSTSVHLAFLDDDATLDAFVGRGFGQPSKVWFNDGSGQFADSGQSLDSASNDVVLADFDGDGDVDAYSANDGASKVWINQGGDQGGPAGVFADSGQELGTALTLSAAGGDLDGNPGIDVYDANTVSDRLWLNDGSAVFSVGSGGSESATRDVALADFDGNGSLDAFLATPAANEVWIRSDRGHLLDSGLRLGDDASEGLAVADVDGDGDQDVFVANSGAPNRVWLNRRLVPNPSGFGWQAESVATTGLSGLRGSLGLDQQGFPHVAFVEHRPVASGNHDRLKYGYWDGLRWHFEDVDAAPFIGYRAVFDSESYVSLALDTDGGAHIAYPAGASSNKMNLRYASRSGDFSWTLETVDDGEQTNRHVSLALDGEDRPHIIYHVNERQEMLYARQDNSAWLTEVIDDSNIDPLGTFARLVMDADGRLHVAYFADRDDDLRYAVREAGGWQTALVDDNPDNVRPYPDIAIGPDGRPAIAYVGPLDEEVRYAAWDGTAWQVTTAYQTGTGSVDHRVGLEFDTLGDPHIVFGQDNGQNLFLDHLYRDNGAWAVERLDNSGQAGSHVDTAIDADGNLHAIYYERAYGDLRHLSWGPNWEHRIVAGGDIRSPSVAQRYGAPGIGFYDQVSGRIRTARWGAGWQVDNLDFVSLPAEQVSHAVGANWQHTSYYDADNQRLMYARQEATGWTLRIVDEAGDVGRHNDLLLLGLDDNRPRIAYWDAALQRVKVAALDSSPAPEIYTNTTGPALNGASGYPAIGALPGGMLGVSYYDGVNSNLRFASLDPSDGAWTDQVVDGLLGADVGRLNDLQVDGTEGEPVVAYFDESNEAVKFAYRQGGAWHIEEAVPASGPVTALALGLGLDSRTRARIAYATTDGAVRLAILNDGSWSTTPVANGARAEVKALSLDLDARPHLAIAHQSDGLVYAFRAATLDLDNTLVEERPPPTGGYYNPLDACGAVFDLFLGDDAPIIRAPAAPVAPAVHLAGGDDLVLFGALRKLFAASPGGQGYIDLYLQHGSEMGQLGLDDPALLWDAFGTLQNFLPGLEALVNGRGDEVLVTQQMVDDALDIWQRLAAAGSPELADVIKTELAASNDLKDFVGLSFNQWAEEIGVEPPSVTYLPLLQR